MKRAYFLTAPLTLALAACGDEADTDAAPVEQGGEIEGDVLGGTISDDMLPLEELTSQSPSAKKSGDASNGAPDDAAEDEN